MSDGRGAEPAKGDKHSWKKKARTPSVATGGKYWATGSGSKPIVSGNLVRLFVALAVLLTTTAALVLYLWNQNSSTPFISIAAIDYEHPWAPNAWAKEDQRRFQGLSQSSQFTVSAKQEKKEGTWQDLISLELGKITPGGPGGSLLPFLFGYRSVIVHLSAHGVLNGRSEPCLLFADADPLDDETWVPLSKVLSAIGEHAIVANHQARVLVILDTGKQPPDFRCGLLSSGFIDAARERIQSLPFANFAVLLSCAEDQCAWTAPEIEGTVFGFMVATGLQGTADALSGDGDTRVTVQELANFVETAVDGYVREHRGRVQNPSLVWCGEEQNGDFELCFRSSYNTSAASIYQPNSRVKRLSEAWVSFDNWNKRTPSYASWQRATALARLTRAEQLMWAGSAYQDQFEQEIARAEKVFLGTATSDWPGAICGSSLVFLNRVHHRDPAAEIWATAKPLESEPRVESSLANSAAEALPATATSASASDTKDVNSASSDSTQGKPTSGATAPPPTPAQQIIRWLTFDGREVEGQPPPERPELPQRSAAVEFVYDRLSENSQFVNAAVLDRFLDWIGPTPDPQSVTREEALLRTIQAHLQLTSSWELPAENRFGQLWSQYLQAADACEVAIATIEPRATQCLERNSAELLVDLQIVRDRIHGCQTPRDASDCAIDLEALQLAAKKTLDIRDRLERAWRLRDELALELPTLAQWIASPIARLQPLLSTTAAWELSQQLIQQLDAIQVQLAAGQVPETTQLETVDQQLEKLVSAYSRSVFDLTDVSAKGQRRPLGNLMLSLGLRPSIYRGLKLNDRGRLHQGLDNRYRDFQDNVSQESLAAYSKSELTEGVDSQLVWQPSDLPDDLSTSFAPLPFTEIAAERKLSSPQATAKSARDKLAAVGAELRGLWKDLPTQLAQRSRSAVEAMGSLEKSSITEAEGKLQSAEHHAQLLAQLVPIERLVVQPVPAVLANSVCTEQYALWQARRSLLDFWYTPVLPQAFMLASSLDWQAIASRLPARGPIKLTEQLHEAAAENGVSWRKALQSLEAGKPPENLWQATLSLASFPTGRAWLRLALDGNEAHIWPLENNRFQLEMGTGALAANASRLSLAATDLPEGNHELIAWFRGHAADAPIPIYRQEPPVTLAWQSEGQAETTIRVNADPKPARIVFVLDCSGSMGDTRMQTAKDTLLDALRDLSRLPEGRTEIAVVLFGHTAEYSKAGSDDYSKWPGNRNRPYNDVEVVQGLVTPTTTIINELQGTLANLKCWGRTPLYEAIRQSVDLLLNRNDGFTGDLRVVVITDGDDNVFPYANGLAGNATAKGNYLVPNQYVHTEQAAIGFAAGQVSLDFVAFNFKSGAGGDANKLETMARQTGGKVYKAGDQDLADQLRNSIARDTYSTRNLQTKRTIGTAIRLSDELRIEPSQIPGQFEVQIDNTTARKTVALLGGETIELQYRRQLGLSFLPHDEGDMYPEPGEFYYADQPYEAIMLNGKPDNVPQIHMCLQSKDLSRQSVRPERFLLEVRRVSSGKSGGERIAWTSDVLWENNHRSPVLRATFKNLPELQRDWLETRLWIAQPASGGPSQRLSVARFKEQAVQIAPGVSASAETRTESGGLRLTLTENRQADSPLIHWQVLPIPDKFVEHQIHDKRVVHEFFFSDAQIQNQIELAATPLPEVAADDWQATPWLRIPAWK